MRFGQIRHFPTRHQFVTEHLSSTTKMILHRAYQQMIGLGPVALKFILQELQERPDYWFWALESISGENPVQPEDDFDGAVVAWLNWGDKNSSPTECR